MKAAPAWACSRRRAGPTVAAAGLPVPEAEQLEQEQQRREARWSLPPTDAPRFPLVSGSSGSLGILDVQVDAEAGERFRLAITVLVYPEIEF